MSDKPTCPQCGRWFNDVNGLRSHHIAKHRTREEARADRAKIRAEREPSMAEELVDAIENFAAGVKPPEHLAIMFPEHFRKLP